MEARNEAFTVCNSLIALVAIQTLFVADALKAAETNFLIIKSFGSPDQAAMQPNQFLAEGNDGKLYGTSWAGGKYGVGVVFRLNKNGTDFGVIHHFSGPDGSYVSGGVIEGSD